MPVIPFNDFLPDAADLGNPGAILVKNALPGPTGYKPFPAPVVQTGATTARPRGALSLKDKDGNVFQFAGDETKLYQLSGATWNDVSVGGGYATGSEESWELIGWKNKVLATNFSNDPQQITMGAANFSALTTAFKCRHLAAIGNFVVAANTSDATDGSVPNRVRWSAFDDETDWTVSATTLSDFRDLQRGGGVAAVVGGEFGVVVLDRSTWRMTFVGAPTVFQFDEVIPDLGALVPRSVVRLADTVYFLSELGFIALQGGSRPTLIGSGKIDKFIFQDIDEAFLFRWSAVADVRSGRVFWIYPGAGNTAGRPNKMLVYDRGLDKWTPAEIEAELLWRGAASGFDLDTTDTSDPTDSELDSISPSLDSPIYKGGQPQLAMFDQDFKSNFFAGLPLTAEFETRESEFNRGRKTRFNAFRSLVDGGTVTAQIGARDRQSDPVSFGPVLSERSSGRFTPRSHARYHRARLTVSGDWKDAIGIQVEREDARPGGRR